MLTLTEAHDIISHIDTDADVIAQACKRYLGQELSAATKLDAHNLASEIVGTFGHRCEMEVFIEGLVVALASTIALCVKPGHERSVLATTMQLLSSVYGKCIARVIMKDTPNDPIAALERLSKIIGGFPEKKS